LEGAAHEAYDIGEAGLDPFRERLGSGDRFESVAGFKIDALQSGVDSTAHGRAGAALLPGCSVIDWLIGRFRRLRCVCDGRRSQGRLAGHLAKQFFPAGDEGIAVSDAEWSWVRLPGGRSFLGGGGFQRGPEVWIAGGDMEQALRSGALATHVTAGMIRVLGRWFVVEAYKQVVAGASGSDVEQPIPFKAFQRPIAFEGCVITRRLENPAVLRAKVDFWIPIVAPEQ